jgi:hypothetical protein
MWAKTAMTKPAPVRLMILLRLSFQSVYVSAVGNTWIPSQQGADAQGRYAAASGSGAKLEIIAAVNTGRNHVKPYGGTTLLLAENP